MLACGMPNTPDREVEDLKCPVCLRPHHKLDAPCPDVEALMRHRRPEPDDPPCERCVAGVFCKYAAALKKNPGDR